MTVEEAMEEASEYIRIAPKHITVSMVETLAAEVKRSREMVNCYCGKEGHCPEITDLRAQLAAAREYINIAYNCTTPNELCHVRIRSILESALSAMEEKDAR